MTLVYLEALYSPGGRRDLLPRPVQHTVAPYLYTSTPYSVLSVHTWYEHVWFALCKNRIWTGCRDTKQVGLIYWQPRESLNGFLQGKDGPENVMLK